jgi:prepilin-type N-terminal cleavage/methylation domain-containing protein
MTAYFKKVTRGLPTQAGFTLIELLIVMAILGVLAVVVLVAINPVQQLARTRDAGRKSAITQIGHALQAYYTTHGGDYVTEDTSWVTTLVGAGELSSVPSDIAYRTGFTPLACTTAETGTHWCYDWDNGAMASGQALVYVELESDSERSKCTTAGDNAWFVWDTESGRGGLVCLTAAEPNAGGWPTGWDFNATQ